MATAPQTAERPDRDQTTGGWPALGSVARTVRNVRDVVTDARQAAESLTEGTADTVRQHPLATVGVAAAAGFLAGGLIGFAYAWFTQRRTR